MTRNTRRLSRGLSAMLYAWLSVSLWLVAVSQATAAPEGSARLDDGQILEWRFSDHTPSPTLGLAAPSYVEWTAHGITGPIPIEMHTNYAAFIERWELSLYRAGDAGRKHPVRIWHGSAAELNNGIKWDGTVTTGPALRPGEKLLASLRVRDVAGNIDEVMPQSILVSRYLMPTESKRLNKLSKSRHGMMQNLPKQQTIPVRGKLLTARIDVPTKKTSFFVSGMAMRKGLNDTQIIEQILPPGNHTLKVQAARPILGGHRLVSAGRLFVTLQGDNTMMVAVRGTGEIARSPHNLKVQNLSPDGIISGSDAATLNLWDQASPSGRLALALIDPRHEVPLFRDDRSRSIMRFDPPQRDAPWGESSKAKKASTIEMRARYPAITHRVITLPHTDIETVPFRLSIRSGDTRITYLIPFRHYELDTLQGRVKLTDAGREVIGEEAARFPDSVVEGVYQIRQSFAGLSRQTDVSVVNAAGSGEALNNTFKTEPAPGTESENWITRNFGWLFGS